MYSAIREPLSSGAAHATVIEVGVDEVTP